MLILTINELRSISKGRNIDGYTNVFKKLLEDLFTKPQKSKRLVPSGVVHGGAGK